MIQLARKNAARAGVDNVEFKLSKITELPIEANIVDCVISNCVLNLVADNEKRAILSEVHRVLKPGGRMAVSDFLALKPLPADMKNDAALFAGCVAGAIEVPEMEKYLKEAGFKGSSMFNMLRQNARLTKHTDVLLVDSKKDLSLYKDGDASKSVTPCCAGGDCGPKVNASGRQELDYDINEWISKHLAHERICWEISADMDSGSFQIYAVKGEGSSSSAIVAPVAAKSCCGCGPGKC